MDFFFLFMCVEVCPAPGPFYLLFNIHVRKTLPHPRRICLNSSRQPPCPPPPTQWDESQGLRRKPPLQYARVQVYPVPLCKNGEYYKETCCPISFILKENIQKIVCPSSRVFSYFLQPSSARLTLTVHSA